MERRWAAGGETPAAQVITRLDRGQPMSEPTQYCPRCGVDLPVSAYYERHRGKPGNYCAEDNRDYLREYKRARRHGAPAVCGVSVCPVRVIGGAARLYCVKHQRNVDRTGDPLVSRLPSTTYGAVHMQVTKARGRAATHPCAGECGRQARDWAYDHRDPDALTCQWYGKTVQYSLNPEHYRPMCRPCHTVYDKRDAA